MAHGASGKASTADQMTQINLDQLTSHFICTPPDHAPEENTATLQGEIKAKCLLVIHLQLPLTHTAPTTLLNAPSHGSSAGHTSPIHQWHREYTESPDPFFLTGIFSFRTVTDPTAFLKVVAEIFSFSTVTDPNGISHSGRLAKPRSPAAPWKQLSKDRSYGIQDNHHKAT